MPLSLHTYQTSHSHHSIRSHHTTHPATSLTRDFGGFPSLFSIIKQIVRRLFPTLERKLTRTVTIPATVSLTPGHHGVEPGKKKVPYISFEAVVGRNSAFHLLTSEQLDEIGGVEYRALNALLWIVSFVGCAMIFFLWFSLIDLYSITLVFSLLHSRSLHRTFLPIDGIQYLTNKYDLLIAYGLRDTL